MNTATETSPSIWSTRREAVRGSHQDFTEAPIGRAIVLLAVPMVLEMLMESVFVIADVFFVGRLGAAAVATVGITESLMTILYGAAIGLSIGATATVARRTGEKDPDGAARAAVQSIIVGLLFAVLFGAIGVTLGPRLLALMGADGFNGAGDTRTPTLAYLFCLWFWEIPLAWVLSHPIGFGPDGVFAAVTIGLATLAAVSVWQFSKGEWKTRRV